MVFRISAIVKISQSLLELFRIYGFVGILANLSFM